MASFLNIVAGMLGAAPLDFYSWGSLRRHHVMAVTEPLRDTGRVIETVSTYISAIKGVVKEAWMLRLMDVESFKHTRALPPEEIRALFTACEADVSSIGVRDAGGYARLWPAPVGGEGLDLGDIVSSERVHRVPDKGNKERLAYMLAGTWQRLRIWIDDVRGE